MLLWQGSCVVHDEYKALELIALKAQHPNALVLVHPESPRAVVKLADVVGSTSQLIKAAQASAANSVHRRNRQWHPAQDAHLMPRQDLSGSAYRRKGANCTSCSHCPWMAMNGLINLAEVLETGKNEIHVDPAIIPARGATDTAELDFAKQINMPTRGIGNA